MAKVIVFHRDPSQAHALVDTLRRLGLEAQSLSQLDSPAFRSLIESPPDLFLIDLGRAASMGRDFGIWLRNQKATRHVPLVFLEGDTTGSTQVRNLLPDAFFAGRGKLAPVIEAALRTPQVKPVVPGLLDGYSGRPLPRKLGIAGDAKVLLLGAPDNFEEKLEPLPDGVQLEREGSEQFDLILLFSRSRQELARQFDLAVRRLGPNAKLWLIWPKKASGVTTDLTQPRVRAFGLGAGFVDYKICSVDNVWSGLLFTRRK